MRPTTIHRLAYNRRPPMAWGDKKITFVDTDYQKPRQLPPSGYANPEVRAVDAAHEALRSSGNGAEHAAMMDTTETRRMAAMEREMDRAQEHLNKPKIEQIKNLVKALTYGEMIQIAEQWA